MQKLTEAALDFSHFFYFSQETKLAEIYTESSRFSWSQQNTKPVTWQLLVGWKILAEAESEIS